jgi:hypothetical protein
MEGFTYNTTHIDRKKRYLQKWRNVGKPGPEHPLSIKKKIYKTRSTQSPTQRTSFKSA